MRQPPPAFVAQGLPFLQVVGRHAPRPKAVLNSLSGACTLTCSNGQRPNAGKYIRTSPPSMLISHADATACSKNLIKFFGMLVTCVLQSLVPEIQLALMVSVRCGKGWAAFASTKSLNSLSVKMASYQTAPLSAVRNAGLVKLEQMAEADV